VCAPLRRGERRSVTRPTGGRVSTRYKHAIGRMDVQARREYVGMSPMPKRTQSALLAESIATGVEVPQELASSDPPRRQPQPSSTSR
jgi:hypothetical protein